MSPKAQIGARRTRPFARHVAFRAHERLRLAFRRDQPDVRELRAPIHEDDVAWLHVAMDETLLVQPRQSAHHIEREPQRLGGGEESVVLEIGTERARRVISHQCVSNQWHRTHVRPDSD